jgi:phospholipid/cholesterol/gamma-HCH transport system substrate-binding protein
MGRLARVGAFILATLVILAIGVFLIGEKQFLFSSTYQLKARFKTVGGLNGGAEVRVGGIHKGTVAQIQLPTRSDGVVTVVMELQRSTQAVVKKDSVVSIETEGLVGDKYVEISFGSPNTASVENGDTLQGAPPLEIGDVVKKTNEVLEAAKGSLDELQAIGEKINNGQGTMGALINDKKMYREMSDATAQAKLGAAAFQEDMEALKHNWLLRGFFNRRGYEDTTKLARYEIARLPSQPSSQRFVVDAKQIFDKPDSAKLANPRALNDAGQYLEHNPFGLAVVVAYQGMKGDAEEARALTQGRALVVRDYLVGTFKMDDTNLRTLGLGKQQEKDAGEAGKVEILVYPPGSTAPLAMPTSHRSPAVSPPKPR